MTPRMLRSVLSLCVIVVAAMLAACTPPPCGGAGQDCCEMGPSCRTGLACRGAGCQRSACVACGGTGQPCCDTGVPCTGTGGFCSGGVCDHCGGSGEACCGTSCLGDAMCLGGRCVTCGDSGEPCCGSSCHAPLQCQPTTVGGSSGRCVSCGGEGEVCCSGSGCRDGRPCNANGTCGLCGMPGQACCPGLRCTAPAECFSVGSGVAMCANCGGRGEACCQGVSCRDASLFCSSGTCQPCGDIGEPCCTGGTCPTSGACIAGSCRNGGDAGGAPAACTSMTCPTGETCLPYPSAVCTHPCTRDADCGPGRACADGICLPSCAPGGTDCDRYGAACYTGLAPYTSLDAPTLSGTPRCFASCFPASATPPAGFPGCPTGTTCDPASGRCSAGALGHVAVGAPCTGASDCEGVCLQPLDKGVPTGFVGGYCVALARNPDPASIVAGGPLPTSNCPAGGVAIPMPTSRGGDVVACYAACANDCDCRIGYACERDPLQLGAASPNGVCLPVDCAIAPSACPTGSVCYRAGPFSHRLHPVCGPTTGLDGGYDPHAVRTGCESDGGMDAALDAIDAASSD